MIEIVQGDLFDAQEKYLVHQCNCVTNRAAHLAKDVFAKYPYADIYTPREKPDNPGHIIIRGNGQDQRFVVALLGQYYPGTPKFPTSKVDGVNAREKYFYHSLLRLAQVPNLESIAFPWKIACGAAGGNWEHYLGKINNFAKYVGEKDGTLVRIYQREGDE
jgi:O-acetyl-ADP-ribose deacetylase (regulator of RNase III)